MSRIFLSLASLSLVLVIVALMLGLTMGDLDPQSTPAPETLHRATLHRLTGVAAALAVVFVECIVVTYFIGTSRWCKEVVETYQLDRSVIAQSNRLKRRTFPWALIGMLTVVGIVALGGAADPGATVQLNARTWAYWHLLGAMLGIVLVMWTYLIAWNSILANHAIIERVMDEVAQIRERRGLTAEEVRN
jgi:amino acid transporter